MTRDNVPAPVQPPDPAPVPQQPAVGAGLTVAIGDGYLYQPTVLADTGPGMLARAPFRAPPAPSPTGWWTSSSPTRPTGSEPCGTRYRSPGSSHYGRAGRDCPAAAARTSGGTEFVGAAAPPLTHCGSPRGR